MKKILSILLAAALLLGLGTVGAGALKLPEPKFELPAYAGALALPKPKIEPPASSAALFPAFSAARALTDPEIYEILNQFDALLWETYMGIMSEMELLDASSPALILLLLFYPDLGFFLKDGVNPADFMQAYEEAIGEIEDVFMVDALDLLFDVFVEFFGFGSFDDLPDVGEAGFDELMEALQAALEDGSLKAAFDAAAQAYLAEVEAAYAYLDDALAAFIKPEALDFATEYTGLVTLYYDFYLYLMTLDFYTLTDAEADALMAIYYGIYEKMSTIGGAIDALLAAGKWTEATALTAELSAEIAALVAVGMTDPLSAVFTLTYDLMGGTGGPSSLKMAVLKNTTATLSTSKPTKAGFTFGGWSATSGGTAAITSVAMDGNKTVYAIWTPVPVYYTLTYDMLGGTGGPAPQANILAGTTVTLATTGLPTKAGFTFGGWSATSGGTAAITSVAMDGNKTVYAVWEKLPEKSAFEQWKDKLADGKFGGLFKGLATWADFLLYIIYFVFFGWLGNIIVK